MHGYRQKKDNKIDLDNGTDFDCLKLYKILQAVDKNKTHDHPAWLIGTDSCSSVIYVANFTQPIAVCYQKGCKDYWGWG